jgi:CubicO group peptidase (beta-lactamase class C family)
MRPRDVAKFGYLFLNEGRWRGTQVLPREWVEETMETYITYQIPGWSNHYGDKYGYQWWQKTYDYNGRVYEAVIRSGWGCQKIVIFPEHELMVVLNGGYYSDYEPYNEIILEHVLPALIQ